MGGRAFDYEAALFIETAQWACNGSAPACLIPTSRPLQGLPIGKALTYGNSNGHPHGQPKPSKKLFITYAMVTQIMQGTSDFNALWLTS